MHQSSLSSLSFWFAFGVPPAFGTSGLKHASNKDFLKPKLMWTSPATFPKKEH